MKENIKFIVLFAPFDPLQRFLLALHLEAVIGRPLIRPFSLKNVFVDDADLNGNGKI